MYLEDEDAENLKNSKNKNPIFKALLAKANKPSNRRIELVKRFRRTIRRLLVIDSYGKSLGLIIDFKDFSFEDLTHAEENFHQSNKLVDISELS